jgi:anthranilate phosphoribosyltransferase
MLSEFIDRLRRAENLSQEQAATVLELLLDEATTDEQIAQVLTLLAEKGETEAELAGFAATMRRRSAQVSSQRHGRLMDTCGTGGSAVKTFNVSTATAFVIAASGIPIAKHGNVGLTSKSGSADVLRALGIKIDVPLSRVSECLDKIGLCFMFAPLHHPATKRVAMVRRSLGIRTIFNLLGPLTNPAGAQLQLAGVSNESACEKVAASLQRLGTHRAWVVRGNDGLDEITLADSTVIYEVTADSVNRFEVVPEDFGLSRAEMNDLRGGTPEDNAEIIISILNGRRRDAARDLVLMNAAAAICLGEGCVTLPGAVELAAEIIDSGKALSKLDDFKNFTQAE